MEEESKHIFILDILKHSIGQKVTLIGRVEKKKRFKKGLEGVWIKDITGVVLIIINSDIKPENIRVMTHIRISGQIQENRKKVRIINNVSSIEVLLSPDTRLYELDREMREQTSSMLISRISYEVSRILLNENFIEFRSRVISSHWEEDGFEPLQVVYPGFGSPAVLIPSPSTQIVEFLTTTLLPRAFTISTSFTQSYRFPNGSAEICVIVLKATNLDLNEQIRLLKKISVALLAQITEEVKSFALLEGEWPVTIEQISSEDRQLSCDLNLITCSANMPVISKNWNAHINVVLHLLDKDKNLLAEGQREQLTHDIEISTITIYPSQFLGLIEKDPRRQLQNLMRLHNVRRNL